MLRRSCKLETVCRYPLYFVGIVKITDQHFSPKIEIIQCFRTLSFPSEYLIKFAYQFTGSPTSHGERLRNNSLMLTYAGDQIGESDSWARYSLKKSPARLLGKPRLYVPGFLPYVYINRLLPVSKSFPLFYFLQFVVKYIP